MPPISIGSYGCSKKETTDKISGLSGVDAHGGDSAKSHAMTRTSQEDELVSTLEDCVSVLRSGLQEFQNISIEDLVFCKPPKDANPLIPHAPTLQVLATTNLPFMEYHDWIMTLYSEMQNLDCGSFERCEHIKHGLLEDLQKEWAKLEDLKHRAWQMSSQRNAEPGSAQIINTCGYMVITLEILFANIHLGSLSPSF